MRSLALVADLNGATLAGVVGVAGANADLEDTSVSGEIGSGDDVHWFAVELAADVLYQILVEGRSSNGGTLSDPLLVGIYDADGDRIDGTRDDDGGRGTNSRLEFRPTAAGRYYIAVQGRGEAPTGTYRVSALDVSTGDDYGADRERSGTVEVAGS